ncbi:MAG: type I DNA topoisomerase [Clostridiaceae bacterium]|nr:type I DNA topoisomerase [Clostridiaceae bacterium]
MSKLLIVESPAKAKTITKYLGEGYSVEASMGHLRDLPKKELGVDVENNFEAKYIPIEGKDKIIKNLKTAVNKADIVYLATDPDREGEAISWHLKELLGLDGSKAKRITFNEITKKAVTEAVQAPRELDMNLVDAQQARRILDRIVGYKLSPFLWRKVRTGLSAGRVQSAVTRMVVDREREIKAFEPREYWSIEVTLQKEGKKFLSTFQGDSKGKIELENEDQTSKILDAINGKPFTVASVKNSKKKRQPAPPFITSTLQQEASRKLSMTAKRTMSVAQELYEGVELGAGGVTGLITYMRTDSLRISDQALVQARDYIGNKYGNDYRPQKPRVFKTKKGAQDAHEAIRPSNPELAPEEIRQFLTADQYKVYRLIWSRFVASQMSEAVLNTISIDIENSGYIFRTTGQTVAFQGFLALYEESRDDALDDEDSRPLPELTSGDVPEHISTEPKQHFTQPPPRYTEASLIKTMEEKGIGRPSTYAPTISVVLEREYVAKEGKALKPTMLGEAVTDLMIDKFSDIVDLKFTAQMEDSLDEVESGEVDYRKILEKYYDGFSKELAQAEIDLEKKRIKVKDEETDIVCELCGRKMVIKSGRFGKFLACPGYPECKNTKPIAQDTGVPCPVCGAKLLKKKSKSGYYYYGCEKNPECPFMTWDTPTKQICPKCGGVIYKRYTKAEKKNLCHVPGCGYEEPLPERKSTRKPKAAEDGTEGLTDVKKTTSGRKTAAEFGTKSSAVKKPAKGRKAKAETETAEVKKPAKGRKAKAETEATAVKKPAKGRKAKAETEATAVKKPAKSRKAKADNQPETAEGKKPGRKKKTDEQ